SSPNAIAPPNSPKNTTKPPIDVLPLSSSGRSTLSIMLMPKTPASSISTPRVMSPDRSSTIPAGAQMIDAPIGSSEQSAMTTPQNAGDPRPSSQTTRPPTVP